jgi:putative hemolysin
LDAEPPLSGFLLNIFLANGGFWNISLSIILLLVLLLCSALVSGSEVAFFSLDENKFDALEKEDSPGSNALLKLRKKPRHVLATILIANNFINIAIVILSAYILSKLLPEGSFLEFGKQLNESFVPFLSAEQIDRGIYWTITVIGVTFLLVLFGEVAPKIYANINNLRFAKMMSRGLRVLFVLFNPISNILVKWSGRIEKRVERNKKTTTASLKEDIDKAIELTVSQEVNAEEEADILKGIINFGDTTVTQIMTPRIDVKAIDETAGYHELLTLFRESGFSRIPVIKEDFDNVIGIIYGKDLVGLTMERDGFTWQKLIRTRLLYAPESKKINDLMKEFQQERMHLAIVVDEYGGSSGIITLEDIIEEIVGEIKDEFDEEEDVEYVKIDENMYIFEGKTLINDVCRIIGVDSTTFNEFRADADTLGGIFIERLGRIPKVDREIHFEQFYFKVVSVSKRRIEKVSLTIKS